MAKVKKRRSSLPYLFLNILVPYLRITTALNYVAFEMESIEIIMLRIHFFKWKFDFRLYSPMYAIRQSEDSWWNKDLFNWKGNKNGI